MEIKELTRQALTKLILHEVGHTLGLNHNFRASHLYDPVTIHKKEITSKSGLTGSVMDYMPANIAPAGVTQGEYYITKPGQFSLATARRWRIRRTSKRDWTLFVRSPINRNWHLEMMPTT